MNKKDTTSEESNWLCTKCSLPLEIGRVNIGYLGEFFPVELPRCPKCGQAYISEELALGKMADVERLLEDK